MAEQLIASMTGEFAADEFRDDYRAALMAMIEAKVGGEAPVAAQRVEPTRIGDLMAALEASVAAARQARTEGTADVAEVAEATATAQPRSRKTA